MAKVVFCFGSNEAGIHGAGAARVAYEQYGARMKFSYGHWSDSFAIPTKDQTVTKTLPIIRIKRYVLGFIAYAEGHPELLFKVTRIGCGLAGLKDEQIAPMFIKAPLNCEFDEAWRPYLGDEFRYWGTF